MSVVYTTWLRQWTWRQRIWRQCQKESKRIAIHANESYFHNNGFAFGLVLKKRHKGLGNKLLSTTNGKDSVPKERCLFLVRILTDRSWDRVQRSKSFLNGWLNVRYNTSPIDSVFIPQTTYMTIQFFKLLISAVHYPYFSSHPPRLSVTEIGWTAERLCCDIHPGWTITWKWTYLNSIMKLSHKIMRKKYHS